MVDLESLIGNIMNPPIGGWRCRCGEPIGHPGVCDRCARRYDRQRAESHRGDCRATIPFRFRWAQFDEPLLTERCGSSQVRTARALLDQLGGELDCIVFHGAAGSGKTSLACACLRHAIDELPGLGFSGRYASALEVSAAMRDHDSAQVSLAKSASVLVLDDVGQERFPDAVREVIHARHDSGRPMLITTFLAQDALLDRMGAGTERRLFERAAVVQMGGRS